MNREGDALSDDEVMYVSDAEWEQVTKALERDPKPIPELTAAAAEAQRRAWWAGRSRQRKED